MDRSRLVPLAIGLCLLGTFSPATAREIVRAPAGGGPGTAIHQPDQLLPPGPAPAAGTQPAIVRHDGSAMMRDAGDILGGDDVVVASLVEARQEDMDIASNGDVYIAVGYTHPTDGNSILVSRSTDGGTTFQVWGEFRYPGTQESAISPSLVVAEGVEDRCYVAFGHTAFGLPTEIIVAWEDLSSPSADFADRAVALSYAGEFMTNADLAVDDAAFDLYYLYLVAQGTDDDGGDIWFTRSLDQGGSWDASYRIASTTANTGDYVRPSVSHGFGSHVHVAWSFDPYNSAFDSALRYRRAANEANGGLSDWGAIADVSPPNDGFYDRRPHIEASHDSGNVVLAYHQEILEDEIFRVYQTPKARVATDQGAGGFGASPVIELWPTGAAFQDLLYNPADGAFYASFSWAIDFVVTASASAPSTWTEYGTFYRDQFHGAWSDESAVLAVDPTHGNRLAVTADISPTFDDDVLLFDAEWRTDPGYPVHRPGFPVNLASAPVSDPALVDLNGDGILEIVFGDAAGNVRAFEADGLPLPGWPVNVGSLSSSPIAVGQLTMSDEPLTVAGTADGLVYALEPDGTIATGWPYDMMTGAPAHVSIGALGGPFPRTIAVASGDRIMFLDHRGRFAQGTFSRQNISHTAVQPCAIGDVDGDGVAEVVAVWDDQISAFKAKSTGSLFAVGLLEDISGPVTLGDVDLDGDLEIAVPLADGTMHLLDHTGAELPGWPFVSTADTPMNGAVWADVTGFSEPELAFASGAWKVHLVGGDGVEKSGFPVKPSIGWFLDVSPVIEQIDGFLPDIAIGAQNSQGWAFNVAGGTIDGWPRQLGAPCFRSPAVADLDGDGFNELVLLTTDQVEVFDLRTAPFGPEFAWPMAGHDARRTGCSDCPEDLVTAVDDGVGAAETRVSFAAPHPNPTSGHAAFSFTVPGRAVVSLDVIDVRGRRIRTIERSEMSAGAYRLSWDGRDQSSRPVADGVYYARLRVTGPGLDESITRKVMLVR